MVGCGYDGSSKFEPVPVLSTTLYQVHDVHARSDHVAPRLRKMEGVAGSNHGGDAQESVRCSRYNVGRGHKAGENPKPERVFSERREETLSCPPQALKFLR